MKRKLIVIGTLVLASLGLSQCKEEPQTTSSSVSYGTPFNIDVPAGFPSPNIPANNPMTLEAVSLGRHLFYEKSLSDDNSISCATCHIQERAFTDATALSVGTRGLEGRRKAMPIFNLAFQEFFFWDGRTSSLEEQSLHPILDTLEMDNDLATVMQRLAADPLYPPLFEAAFGDPSITEERIAKSLAQFERTLISANSKFDRVIRLQTGEQFTPLEQRGYELFTSDFDPNGGFGGDCFHCHGERETQYLFGAFGRDLQFVNNGLKDVYADQGRADVSNDPADIGKFKVPSVRNVEFSFPYMHDGSIPTLDSLIGFYNFGGHKHQNIDPNMKAAGIGRNWSAGQKQALAAFLRTLTDYEFLQDTAFGNPHQD